MKSKCRHLSIVISVIMVVSCILFAGTDINMTNLNVSAASVDYPVQLMRIGLYDNSKNLNISGYTDNCDVIASDSNGSQNQNWRFDYVGTNSNGGFYKIANMGCGRLLTPKGYKVSSGTACVTYGSESHTSQHWYIAPVSKDKYGNGLLYKITNYDAPDLAVTNISGKLSLSAYTGADNQKFLLSSAGIQGFGGYCKDMNGSVKASVIGGVLGETVEVSTFDELKKACTDTATKTIIIKKNISGKTSGYEKTLCYDNNYRYICRDDYIYLAPNKTIIGSYGANTLHNVFFRTYEHENYYLGNNIVIRNINVTHDKELNYDNIWEFSYGWNFWLDHITFNGHEKINGASLGSPDFDKFINFKGGTNFITISDCKIGLGEYGVLLGYPTDTEEIYQQYNGLPCVTLCDNYYKDTLTRAPGLMRYGYFHSMNNYVINFDMGYTIYTAAKLYAEGCYYDAGTGKGSVVNDSVSSSDISSKYPGFYTEVNSTLVNSKYTLTAKTAKPCTWKPSSNYSYKAKSAADAKSYCLKYTGAQTSASAMTYAAFDKAGVPSAGYNVAPDPDTTEPTRPSTQPTQPSGNTVAVIKDKVQNGNVLNAGWITAGEIGSVLKVNDTYSITASSEKLVNVYEESTDTADGKHKITAKIALGGAGNVSQRSVQINAKKSGKLIIYMDSSNPDASRTVNLLDKDGKIIQTAENVVGTSVKAYSFNIPSTGTYYITSASSGVNVYYAELVYSEAPASVNGDANADGKFTSDDVVMLQKWLVKAGSITNSENCDMNKDGKLNVFDLVIMKRLLLKPLVPEEPEKHSYEPENFVPSGKVYLVGDSTVCEYDQNMAESLNRYGWGMKLAEQYDGITVNNLALSGRSSRSFLEEKNYQTLCGSIGKGDYLFIQFGHNDEKTDEAEYPGLGTYPGLDMSTLDGNGKNSGGQYSYEWIILNKYIKIAQSKGAVPVLVTPITRRGADGTAYYQAHTKYQQVLIELGKKNNVAVIDMTELTRQLYTNLYNFGGADETAKMHCYIDAEKTQIDNSHLSNAGAFKIAQMIAEQTKLLGLSIGNKIK